MSLTIGIDIGGTKIAGGVVDESGKIVKEGRRDTPAKDVDATEKAIVDLVNELREGHEIATIGVGAAGWVNETRSVVYFAPHLAWRDEQLGEELTEATGLPVVIENDGNAAAWGEHRFGAGRGARDMLCVTVGTGIGGGLVLDGSLYRGGFGIAGEIGHMQVVPDGRECPCGNVGCWEEYASGRSLLRRAKELAAERPQDAETLLGLGDGTPEGITGLAVTEAAQDDDPVALAAFAYIGHWLGQGMANLVSILDPTVIVIGGGVSEAGELLLEPTRTSYEATISGRGKRPYGEVRLAEHANDAGLIGAADLARR